MFKPSKKIIAFFTVICLMLTVFISSVSAQTVFDQFKPNKATCKLLSTERSDNGLTYKFQITIPDKSSVTNNTLGTNGLKLFTDVVHLGGDGTNVYATSYFVGAVNKYSLSLSLYNGAEY